ncbi:MAG: proline dehydrogenase family protein [Bacteroidales bacterium]
MLDLENTEIAFKHKTDKDLKRAEFMFRLMANPAMVSINKVLAGLALAIRFPVGWAVKPLLYKQFVGGETIGKCKYVVDTLGSYGVKSILDYSVEGSDNEQLITQALNETIRSVKNAGREPDIPFAVFKPTAFGDEEMLQKASSNTPLTEKDEQNRERFYKRVLKLCETAYAHDVPILIDAEDYAYQAHIDSVVEAMMEKFNTKKPVVWNTLQMYRKDRLKYLEDSIRRAGERGYFYGAKFVRGAYMEQERARAKRMGYEDPIQPDKASTDRDYNAALKYSAENIDKVSVFNGTHNEESTLYLTELMEQNHIDKEDPRIFFSQLYGMSDHISFNLAAAGYNVAKYVPYGPVRQVLPYLIRRAEENTSVKGQTGRELSLILKEKRRRKIA